MLQWENDNGWSKWVCLYWHVFASEKDDDIKHNQLQGWTLAYSDSGHRSLLQWVFQVNSGLHALLVPVGSVQVFQAPPTVQEPSWSWKEKKVQCFASQQKCAGFKSPSGQRRFRVLWLPPIVQRHVSGDRQIGVWVWILVCSMLSSVQGVGRLSPEGRICSDRWRWWSKTSLQYHLKNPY